jgi:hypothetical protein
VVASGNVEVRISKLEPALIVHDNEAVPFPASVTASTKVNDPAAVGVPARPPDKGLSARPAGSWPDATAH